MGGVRLPKATVTTARPLEFQRSLSVYGDVPVGIALKKLGTAENY
jgi:hypothetical protein